MGGQQSSIRHIPEHILRFQSPDLTLIEFEQIYDEYLQLSENKEACLEQELVYVHLVKQCKYLQQTEIQAILTETLAAFNQKKRSEANVFEVARDSQGEGTGGSQEGAAPKEEQKVEIQQETIDKDWVELGGAGQMQIEPQASNDRLNSGTSSTAYERDQIAPSFFCGCSGDRQSVNQQQFVTYQRPINRRGTTGSMNEHSERQINVSYISDPTMQVGCSMGGAAPNTTQMVHLPFRDFCELLTFKLLNQLQAIEADTVVEASSQNVSCFFWPSERMAQQQGIENAERQYRLEDFRQSIPLQKAQSQARALVPITEADTEQEDQASQMATVNFDQKSQSQLIQASSGV